MPGYMEIVAWWQSHQVQRTRDLDCLLEGFNPLFASQTNLLEGLPLPFATVEEFFRTGTVSHFSGEPQGLLLLYNQRQCWEYLRERVLARDELDTSLVLEAHRILTSGVYSQSFYLSAGEKPGEFKKQDYVAATNAVGAPAQEVAGELDRLMEQVNGYCGADLLGAAAHFHGQFEHIHPFASGNGTVGRALLNYFLLTRDHPPLALFYEDQEQYLQCLTAFDQTGDSAPLAAFLEEQLIKSWR